MSSKYLINRVLKHLVKPLNTVIEYGPGNGVMTKALLRHLSPQGKLLVIESDARFIKELNQIHDERLEIIQSRVQDLFLDQISIFCQADAIISSIPFYFLTPADRLKVISETHKTLAPGGNFILFHQYRLLTLRQLNKSFNSVSVTFEPRNIFPCFILDAKK